MDSETLLASRQTHLLDSVKHYYRTPLHAVRASMQWVWDAEGRKYLDAFGGVVTVSVGHNHPRIKARLSQWMAEDRPQHTTVLYLTEPVVELAARLTGLAPAPLKKAFFTNSGSEANELAILLARQFTKRTEIIALKHAYHGGTAGALSVVGQHTWRWGGPGLAGVSFAAQPNCYRCPFGATPDRCGLECAEDVEATIRTTTSGEIAAFIAEPIQGVAGFVTPPPAYFKRVHEIVKKFGGLYISDEVQTGVGRTGNHWFGILNSGVTPDILTMAKGLGNGAPIGGLLTTPEISASLKGKIAFSTFAGGPWATLQADETLSILEEDRILEKAARQGRLFEKALREQLSSLASVGDIRGRGLMWGVELVEDRATKAPATEFMTEVMERTRDLGLLIGRGGLDSNVIRLSPPMCLSDDELHWIACKLREAIEAAAR